MNYSINFRGLPFNVEMVVSKREETLLCSGLMFMKITQLTCAIIIIFTNPSTWTEYDTRSIFKWSLTDLNSEFSF